MFLVNQTYPSTHRLFVSIYVHSGAVRQRVYHVDLQQNGRTRPLDRPASWHLVCCAKYNRSSVHSHHRVHAAPLHSADVIDIVARWLRAVRVISTNLNYCVAASYTRLRSLFIK